MSNLIPSAPGARRVLALALGCLLAGGAGANPQGPQVVHGSASFASPSAGVLNITNSPNAIINWQSFGIDPGQITRFIQQHAGSAVLNPLLHEGAIRRNTRTRPNHDDRPRGIIWQTEVAVRLDINTGRIAHLASISEISGGDALTGFAV